jgi:hypothetical protein
VDHDHEVEDQDDLQEEDEEAENLTESAERGKPSHGKKEITVRTGFFTGKSASRGDGKLTSGDDWRK